MQGFTHSGLETLALQSYADGYACHGDLSLDAEAFSDHLHSIIVKRLGADPLPSAAFDLASSLHLNDLYLTLACAQGSEVAWRLFISLYDPSIRRICRCHCQSSDAASEMAEGLPGQLFLPDATGRSRIASYRGFSSLVTWLTVIIKHCAVSEHRLKFNHLERIDQVPDVADGASIPKIEAAIRAGKYERLIKDSLQGAFSLLSDRERSMLRLRYEQQMQVSQVALLLGVKPPAISRQLDRTRQKLREHVISILSTEHRLGPAVIQDCLTAIVENPEHCILALS